jgi:large subunit ribosomal protein L29
MKASELREKTVDELQEELIALMKDRFTYRMEKSTGQLNQTHLVKDVARDIARVKTVLNEKKASDKTVSESADSNP